VRVPGVIGVTGYREQQQPCAGPHSLNSTTMHSRVPSPPTTQLPDPGAVASLQLTPQGVVRSFYPVQGNEQAVAHNLLKDPARRAAALETIERGELTVQGPLYLKQGFVGVVPRLPLFIDNVTDPTERFG